MDQGSGATTGRQDRVAKGVWSGKTCSHEGCDAPVSCKGYCRVHYSRTRWAAGTRSPSHNATTRRAVHLRHRYKLEMAEHDALLAAQDGKCAVCKQPPSKANSRAHWGEKLCVDHDHVTGKIRGLLCNDCNLMVGYGKTPDALFRAAFYLHSHA